MDTDFLTTLLNISDRLSKKDVADIIFLCGKHLRESDKENLKGGTDVFKALSTKGLLSKDNLLFLKELLSRICRKDILLDELKITKAEMEALDRSFQHITPYRSLLYDVSQSLSSDETEKIMYLLQEEMKHILQINKEKCMLVVLSEMEKKSLVSEDNLQILKNHLGTIHRADLCKNIQRFESKKYNERLDLDGKLEKMSLQGIDVSENNLQPYTQNDPSVKDNELETYKLDKDPHGWCIILNNHDFKQARSNKIQLEDRDGTYHDAVAMKENFISRGYEVVQYDNVTKERLLEIMETYSKKDHSGRDSFVCFVFSHGNKGILYGTDGNYVSVKDLTDKFNGLNSPSLVGKPKVFFIQACQGNTSDTGAPYVSDSHTTVYINDGAEKRLPITADFLTAYACVEDYESIRSKYTGSVYIQNLCSVLRDPLFFETDLTIILTKVHKKVADEVYRLKKNKTTLEVKQMPTYQSQLRKALILPPPTNGHQTSGLSHT